MVVKEAEAKKELDAEIQAVREALTKYKKYVVTPSKKAFQQVNDLLRQAEEKVKGFISIGAEIFAHIGVETPKTEEEKKAELKQIEDLRKRLVEAEVSIREKTEHVRRGADGQFRAISRRIREFDLFSNENTKFMEKLIGALDVLEAGFKKEMVEQNVRNAIMDSSLVPGPNQLNELRRVFGDYQDRSKDLLTYVDYERFAKIFGNAFSNLDVLGPIKTYRDIKLDVKRTQKFKDMVEGILDEHMRKPIAKICSAIFRTIGDVVNMSPDEVNALVVVLTKPFQTRRESATSAKKRIITELQKIKNVVNVLEIENPSVGTVEKAIATVDDRRNDPLYLFTPVQEIVKDIKNRELYIGALRRITEVIRKVGTEVQRIVTLINQERDGIVRPAVDAANGKLKSVERAVEISDLIEYNPFLLGDPYKVLLGAKSAGTYPTRLFVTRLDAGDAPGELAAKSGVQTTSKVGLEQLFNDVKKARTNLKNMAAEYGRKEILTVDDKTILTTAPTVLKREIETAKTFIALQAEHAQLLGQLSEFFVVDDDAKTNILRGSLSPPVKVEQT